MKKMNRRKVIIIALGGVAVIAVVVIVLLLLPQGSREPEPERITVKLAGLSDEERMILSGAMEEFSSLYPLMYAAEPADDEQTDVYFNPELPASPDVIVRPWRSFGWRLFSRLPTLANLEGEWKRQLILPLTNNEIGPAEFEAILKRGAVEGLVPIALVADSNAERAFELYQDRLAVDYSPFVQSHPSLAHALSDLSKRRIMFLFWNDSLLPLIPTQMRPQHRGFIFPGSRHGDDTFFVGSVTWIILTAGTTEGAEREGPKAFVKYLTSPGVARLLEREFVGEFFSWPADSVNEKMPEVPGPRNIIRP